MHFVTKTDVAHEERKIELMERAFECYAEQGFNGTGVKALAQACGCSPATLYTYFDNLDDLVVQATEHCMTCVEDDFMARAPKNAGELERFVDEIPYWTAETHGKKYRLMYQVYTHPKYVEHGKGFFRGVTRRYQAYAKRLEPQLGLPAEVITPLIFILIRACVHYALFEDEYYLKAQIGVLKQSLTLFLEKYNTKLGGEKQ